MEKPIGLTALAATLRLPRKWLQQQAEAGRIPCLNVAGRLLFNLDAVRSAIAELAAKKNEGGRHVR